MEDIATDPDGYSYVVGQAYDSTGFMGFPTVDGGGFLAKVSPAGSVIWSHAFTHASFDQIELKNNVLYATGIGHWNVVVGNHSAFVDSTLHGYLVASFDTSGNDLWLNTSYYTGDIATGDIDANDDGELFIAAAGYSQIYTDIDTIDFGWWNRQVLICKFSPTGQLQWISTAGCPGSKSRAVGIACDNSGAAYVTGFAHTDSAYCEEAHFGEFTVALPSMFYLTKISSDGQFVWLDQGFGATGKDVEYIGNDTIAVTGYFYDSTDAVGSTTLQSLRFDMFVATFDVNGNPGWAYQSNAGNDSSYCTGLKLEKSGDGDLLVLGELLGSVTMDGQSVNPEGAAFHVSKISRSGVRLWSATMAEQPTGFSTIEPHGLSSDAAGRAYVSGTFNTSNWLAWNTDSLQGSVSDYSMFVARTADDALSISSPHLIEGINVYPNPCSNILHLELCQDAPDQFAVDVLSTTGEFIIHGIRNGRQASLDVSSLAPGLYVARITCHAQVYHHSFVVGQ